MKKIEQKSIDYNEELKKCQENPLYFFDKYVKFKSKKPAEWSEEDEKERKRVVGLLEGWLYTFRDTCYAEDCKRGIAWLESLKKRMEV